MIFTNKKDFKMKIKSNIGEGTYYCDVVHSLAQCGFVIQGLSIEMQCIEIDIKII